MLRNTRVRNFQGDNLLTTRESPPQEMLPELTSLSLGPGRNPRNTA
jgi:hypothetical protein